MLKGKTALITGASRGIGRAIALALAAQGADVALIYAGNTACARQTAEEAAALGSNVVLHQCDVASYEQCEHTVRKVAEQLGGIDILVNNAGITQDNLCVRMRPEQWDRCLDVNLKGACYMIRQVAPLMLRKRSGRIINITSVAGLMGNTGQANYAAAKAGLIGLTKSVARELAARGITFNAVAPGLIDTDMARSVPEAARAQLLASIPMGRMGRAEEVADLVCYLAGEKAAYMTGTVIAVDGGFSM